MYRIIVRVFKLSSVVLFILTLALPSYAQDTPASSDCPEAADVLPVIAEFLTELADEPATALDVIYEAVVEARAKCAGLVFTSETHGESPVIGPLTLDGGTYRVSLDNDGSALITVDLIDLDGDDCGRFMSNLIVVSNQPSAQAVLQLESPCEALLEFSTINMNFGGGAVEWTLTFEKLR